MGRPVLEERKTDGIDSEQKPVGGAHNWSAWVFKTRFFYTTGVLGC
jgi:hypothetical protein